MQFTLGELWTHMGLFARLIVIVMAVMSVASVLVTFERLLAYVKAKRDSLRFAAKLAPLLTDGRLDEAVALKAGNDGGHLGRVLAAGLGAYALAPKWDPEFTVESVSRALDRQCQREISNLKRGQGLLATVSATAPFVGLLGTVMGIVNSFQMMALSGSGGLGTVSAGIAEALVTTAFGLLVAIPAVMAFNYLNTWVEASTVDMTESANELVDVIARAVRKQAGSTAGAFDGTGARRSTAGEPKVDAAS